VRWPRLYVLAPLLVLLAIYWVFALSSSLNIGHRHLLPMYPPLFILAGAAAAWSEAPPMRAATHTSKKNSGKPATVPAVGRGAFLAARALVVGAVALAVAEAVWMWPDYLAYFNVLAGGPRHGYRHLIDSSLDWGQDLNGLERWLERHPDEAGNRERVYLSYFGVARPEYYGIDAQRLPSYLSPRWSPHVPVPLTGGLYAISATMLQSVYLAQFPGRWNKDYEERYQELRPVIALFQKAAAGSSVAQKLPDPLSREMQNAFKAYEILRFSRLMSFLRSREPDDEVGYTIMIYRVSDADVTLALEGFPRELLGAPEGKRSK
jgi:hypothetical protein